MFLLDLDLLFGPSDVGGQCPTPTFKYGDKCCCSNGCCWEKCVRSTPPKECLQNVPNSQWIYSEDLHYFQAYQTSGMTFVSLQILS